MVVAFFVSGFISFDILLSKSALSKIPKRPCSENFITPFNEVNIPVSLPSNFSKKIFISFSLLLSGITTLIFAICNNCLYSLNASNFLSLSLVMLFISLGISPPCCIFISFILSFTFLISSFILFSSVGIVISASLLLPIKRFNSFLIIVTIVS